MSRKVHMPQVDYTELVLPIEKGGTSAANLTQAAQNLSVITSSMLGMPGGPVPLDALGKIVNSIVQSSVGSNVANVDGPLSLMRGLVGVFTISDYDSFKTYDITFSAGSFTRLNETITYTAPAVIQDVTMTINGRQITIPVTGDVPNKPTLSATSGGGVGSNVFGYLSTSAYSITGSSDTHVSTDWQIATDAAFTNIVAQSLADVNNKVTWLAEGLSLSGNYFARARHRTNTNTDSAWSDTVNFTTAASYTLSTEEAKLSASDRTSGNLAGYSVSMSADGTRVVMGAPNNNAGASNSGAVYVFRRSGTTWVQEQKLIASDFAVNNYLGRGVAIASDGTRLVASAPGNNSGASNKGALYIWNRNTSTNVWTQEAKVTSSDGIANDNLGDEKSLCMDSTGTRIVAGARRGDHSSLTDAGTVYVFRRDGSTWSEEAKIISPLPGASFNFGTAVSISDDGSTLIVGAQSSTVAEGGYGEQIYPNAGTFTFTVPAGVTSLSMVGIAGGGASSGNTGGGGGSLSYKNNFPVQPGDQFTVVVGQGGSSSGATGGFTRITKVGGGLDIYCPGGNGDGSGTSLPTGGDVNSAGRAGSYSYTVNDANGTTGSLYQGAGGIASYSATTPNYPAQQASGGSANGPYTSSNGIIYYRYVNNPSGFTASLSGTNSSSNVKGYGGTPSFDTATETYSSGAGEAGGVRFVWGTGKTYPSNATVVTNHGAAFTFKRTGTSWAHDATFTPPTLVTNSYYGSAVSVSGDATRVAVGAYNITSGSGTGEVYIYRYTGSAWVLEATANGSSRASNDVMGRSVCLNFDGSVCVIGESGSNVSGFTCGAAYVYNRISTNWTLGAKFSPSDKVNSANYGFSTAISSDGTRAVIGSSGAQYSSTAMGGAYAIRK